LDISQKATASAAETGIATRLAAALDARHAAVSPEESAEKMSLHLSGCLENGVRNTLIVSTGRRDADSPEEASNGAAPNSQLKRPVRHLLARYSTDEFLELLGVPVGKTVLDVIAAVDPVRDISSKATVADQMAGQLCELARPPARKLASHCGTPTRHALGELLNCYWKLPARIARLSDTVVEHHPVARLEFLDGYVSAVQGP
jgi:hypothetical protein